MAITKLMHMKEAPGFKARHLSNGIKYVLDLRNGGAKTDYGKWVGGNAGIEHDDILNSFLDTKYAWEKEGGRQGYHFVISFSPGEVDAQTCFNVLQDFCQEYLTDAYDYMFAVHTDQDHMHGHIIFNSINRENGYKYRYEKGDWEKYIQPITNKICKDYKLRPLVMEKERVGVSYAQWSDNKKGRMNWTHIMRADIDFAIDQASSLEEFFSNMEKMNYKLDIRGYSKKHNSNYITYHFLDSDGKDHKRRSYNLAVGEKDLYSIDAIKERLSKNIQVEPYYEKLGDMMLDKVNRSLGETSVALRGTRTHGRLYQAASYYKLPNPYAVPASSVRRDMLRIERLIEECKYIKNNPSATYGSMVERLEKINLMLKSLYIERKMLTELEENVRRDVPDGYITRFRALQRILQESRDFDDRWEAAEDELEELERKLPASFIENESKLRNCNKTIESLKKEKRILERIIKTEGGNGKDIEKELTVKPGKL